tara:strand:- start:571 stop:786 length:216 start_codon:yes stop_codon:yes gene_type:complete
VNLLSKLATWFMIRVKRDKLGQYDFGVVQFGNHELPIVGYRHQHIGPPKLFYVDSLTLSRLSGPDNDTSIT